MLTTEELQELEKEFIEFLILNGIAAKDWLSIKTEHPQKAMRMVELFSDVVFNRILRQTRFLERREQKELKTLQCLDEKFILVGLNASKIHDANLSDENYMKAAIADPPSGLEIYTSDIAYNKSREEEIFDLVENGFEIADGKLFKTLCLVLADS